MGKKHKLRKQLKQRSEERLNKFFQTLTADLEAYECGNSTNVSTMFALSRLKERMRKRAKLENIQLHKQAHHDFVSCNALVKRRSLFVSIGIVREMQDFILYVLEKAMKRCDPSSLQECFSIPYILSNWRFGPKTSNGVEGLGTVEKIDQGMTVTESAEPLVYKLRRFNPYFSAFDCTDEAGGILRIGGSRLSTVLKNETAVRTIAIEPSGNMALQLAGGLFIEEALRGIGLDIRTQQPKNKYLAMLGSLFKCLCTIDLKSASDMIGVDLIELTWPQQWVDFFKTTRSPVCTTGLGEVELNMISTMGNGFTFPMMTLTLVSLIYAMRRLRGGPRRFVDWRLTAVFGDDIIVPISEYDELCRLLDGCGFIVNHEKSYKDGPFRESCGGDYHNGLDVTPFYVKSLNRVPDIHVAINQVLGWSGKHEIPLYRSLNYLRSLLDDEKQGYNLVPEWHGDTAGIRCATGPSEYVMLAAEPIRRRYNGNYLVMLACGGYVDSGKYGPKRDRLEKYSHPETFGEKKAVCISKKQKSDVQLQAEAEKLLPHYSIHPEWVRYRVKKARLPSGYLDGRDPLSRSHRASHYVDLMVDLVFGR